MNKKFLMFGIMGLFALAMVSAMVVSYLSNTAKVEVKVESPMSVMFSNGSELSDNLVLKGTTGLSTIRFSVVVENLANNEIIAPTLEIVVDNGKNTATCDDLTSVEFTDTWCHGELSDDCPTQELVGLGVCNDSTGKAVYSIPTVKYKVGQKTEYPITATWGNVEPSTYNIFGQMLV
jgi:hypothetical protein